MLVRELIQDDMNLDNLKAELSLAVKDEAYISRQKKGYKELVEALGKSGASDRAAKIILDLVSNTASE